LIALSESATTDNPDYVKINLLLYEGKVIGGDICRVTLDGFIVAFK
jgi:hypothetical protein